MRPAPLVLFAVVAALAPVAAACGDEGRPNGWCSLVTSSDAAFDAKSGLDADALREYRRVEAAAPPEIRASVRAARRGAVAYWEGAAKLKEDPRLIEEWLRAKARVDRYLEHECGIDLESRGREGT